MAELHGSAEAANELRNHLKDTTKNICLLMEEEKRQLARLSESCHDSSFQQMQSYMDTVNQYVNEALEDILVIHRNLKRYISLIEMIEKRYHPHGPVHSTAQKWHMTDTGLCFSEPEQLGFSLDIRQGKAGPSGTCGLCSVENVCIMAGKPQSETSVVNTAMEKQLCSPDGGTTASDRQQLLGLKGIPSHLEVQTIDNIASAVMEGRGVILSVNANRLYGRFSMRIAPHAVTVTAVETDNAGTVSGITICDSNAFYLGHSGAKTYPADFLEKALLPRPMNVTEPIR